MREIPSELNESRAHSKSRKRLTHLQIGIQNSTSPAKLYPRTVGPISDLVPVSKKPRRRPPLNSTKYAWRKNRTRFDAFEVREIDPSGNSKVVVVAPETGIHSLQWANSIVAQSSPLLKLPLEIRTKIYIYVLLPTNARPIIKPKKRLGKFIQSSDFSDATLIEYQKLSLVSRQLYVDVTGSSLLYRVNTFVFTSETPMINYLSSINPAHKNSITSIQLCLFISCASPRLSRRALLALHFLPSLKYLHLDILVDYYMINRPIRAASGMQTYPLHNKVLERVKENKHLREITGLKGFEMVFRNYNANLWSVVASAELGKCDQEGKLTVFGEVERELKRVLLRESN